ncbi:MAG: glycosyl hydrolase-related protein [Opitutaceae bacterium]|jgi:alpha-mannosidase
MKKQPVYLVPFSHLDLFWGGSREECLSRGSQVIRTALDLLDEYDSYRFMVESTNFLSHHLDCFPEDLPRVRKHALEGRLELIPMRCIIYSQLPSGETAVRNLLYGREYCLSKVGTYSPVMSLSDIPGVTPQTPQIARLAGMQSLILSRGCPTHTDQIRWKGLDGSELPTYYPWHYGYSCGLLAHGDYSKVLAGEEAFEAYVSAVDYPQIMHLGIDLFLIDKAIVENLMRWNREGRRELRFSTFHEFMKNVCPAPKVECAGEIPSFWPNIESTWPDIWPLDISCEAMMFQAEFFRSLVCLTGGEDDARDALHEAWLWLLDGMDHNQNGCGGEEADDDKRRLKTAAEEVARQYALKCARRLAARATAPRSEAFPIVIFNQLGWQRSELIQARAAIYGHTSPSRAGWGKTFPYRLIDERGQAVPFKQIDHLSGMADTVTVEFFAKDVPAFGAKVYYLEPGEPETFVSPFTIEDDRARRKADANQPTGCDAIENAYFRLEIDRITGSLRIFDKTAQRCILEDVSLVALEERGGNYISHMPLSGRVFPARVISVEIKDHNAVCCRAEIKGELYGQPYGQLITVRADKPEIEIENTISWQEILPVRLEQSFTFPREWTTPEFRYGVPFGQVRYPETIYNENMPFEKVSLPELADKSDNSIRSIRLVNHWLSACDPSGGVVIGTDHRMWEFEERTLRNCMLRGITHTTGGQHVLEDGTRQGTVRPPLGDYRFRFRIAPQPAGTIPQGRCGWELNHPLRCTAVGFSTPSENPGLTLPPMPDCTQSTVILGNVKPSEKSGEGVVFRCFESTGRESAIELPDMEGKRWFETDLMEEHGVPLTSGHVVFRPFEIKTLMAK